MYQQAAEYATSASTKRPSAATAAIPIWHADVLKVIDIRRSNIIGHRPLTDIYPAIMIPDEL